MTGDYAQADTDIVDALPSEGPTLSALAYESKASWGYDEAFMKACKEELTYDAQYIRDHTVREIKLRGEIAGFYSLGAPDGRRVELEALFVAANCQQLGLGRRLMEDAILHAAQVADTMLIQSDPFAEAFYVAMGACRVGQSPSASIPGRHLPHMTLALARA